jgi:hypothetical protein
MRFVAEQAAVDLRRSAVEGAFRHAARSRPGAAFAAATLALGAAALGAADLGAAGLAVADFGLAAGAAARAGAEPTRAIAARMPARDAHVGRLALNTPW